MLITSYSEAARLGLYVQSMLKQRVNLYNDDDDVKMTMGMISQDNVHGIMV